MERERENDRERTQEREMERIMYLKGNGKELQKHNWDKKSMHVDFQLNFWWKSYIFALF